MHVLDDPWDLSDRARGFLARVGDRVEQADRPSEFMTVLDRRGKRVPAPFALVLRREGYARRFGGLRYPVRQWIDFPDGPLRYDRDWEFTLVDHARQDVRGCAFEVVGECVASPVPYMQHVDGRFGIAEAETFAFVPLYASMLQVIESHALLDACVDAERLAVPPFGAAPEEFAASLPVAAEASGPRQRWYADDRYVVRETFLRTAAEPRRTGWQVWAW
ncbi:hypothetical protein [Yinghuangia soli]|uniref:Uncharacterized protein n=1 Tax=Yinghuangia soli TaxID=2908204 RepID=A0AA41PYS7_9ACTN|nr:hypothetical protein [Yinghuangia soli]MCF2527840.1 hypothetical protein [Yinghuangia soli]